MVRDFGNRGSETGACGGLDALFRARETRQPRISSAGDGVRVASDPAVAT
jgi:hypothetical protein